MSAAAGSSTDGDSAKDVSRKELVAHYLEVYGDEARKDHHSGVAGVGEEPRDPLDSSQMSTPVLVPLGVGKMRFGKKDGRGVELSPSYMKVDIDPKAETTVNGGRSFVEVVSRNLDYYTPVPWCPFIHHEYRVVDIEFSQEEENLGIESYLLKAMPHQRDADLNSNAFKPIVFAKTRNALASRMGLPDHSNFTFMPLQIELTAAHSSLPIAMKMHLVTPVPGVDGLFRKWHTVQTAGGVEPKRRGQKSDDDIVTLEENVQDGYLLLPKTSTVNETDSMLYKATPEHKVNSVQFSRWITCDFASLRRDFERVPVDQVFESLSAYALTCPRINKTSTATAAATAVGAEPDHTIGVEHGRDIALWFALNNVEEVRRRTVFYCKSKQRDPTNFLKFFTDSSDRTLLYLVKDVIDEFINELELKYPKRKYLAALGDTVGMAMVLSPLNGSKGWTMLAEEARKRRLFTAGTEDNSARVYLKLRMYYHAYKSSQLDLTRRT